MKEDYGQVIVVDDNAEYTALIEKVLKICKPSPLIKAFHNGSDLLEWLDRGHRPSLIFLDIDMPVLTGFDILKLLKTEEKFETIPVIMLTVSDNRVDMVKSYQLGANACISKLTVISELVARLEVFSPYWSSSSQLPSQSWFRLDDSRNN